MNLDPLSNYRERIYAVQLVLRYVSKADFPACNLHSSELEALVSIICIVRTLLRTIFPKEIRYQYGRHHISITCQDRFVIKPLRLIVRFAAAHNGSQHYFFFIYFAALPHPLQSHIHGWTTVCQKYLSLSPSNGCPR